MTTYATDRALCFQGVSKFFTVAGQIVRALSGIDLEIDRGQVVGLIGPDGAGKTTLLRLATGLMIPDSGEIRLFGQPVSSAQIEGHRGIGYMPQRFGLYEDLTVAENLSLYADLHALSVSKRQARIQALMHMSGLASFQSRLAGKLSGGMKQKLGLACTLLSEPALLILDEPSVGVDPVSRRELWQIIERQCQETGMTVLLSTAYMDEAERCDQVVILNQGKIEAQHSPARFRQMMEGQTYVVSSQELTPRYLQSIFIQNTQIKDAVIQGQNLRIIYSGTGRPQPEQFGLKSATVTIETTPPRLEDAFIHALSQTQALTHRSQTEKKSVPIQHSDHQEAVIVVEHVERWFGDFQAVKDLSFQVYRGEVFGLLGANGAGKTTTFRMLCGLLPVSHGRCEVAGYDFHHAAAKARAKIGYMSQKFSLYSHLTVRQNLAFFSAAYGLQGRQQKMRIEWAIESFELSDSLHATCLDLSLGYKQRLSMACALMHQPQVLFLDEPTSGVDPLARREFWMRINQLSLTGVTILVTTHFMEEAEYCDRLLIMRSGEMLISGSPQEIKSAVNSQPEADLTMEDAFIALVEAHDEHA